MLTVTPVDVTGNARPQNKVDTSKELPVQSTQEAIVPDSKPQEAVSPQLAMLARQQKAAREAQRTFLAQKQAFAQEKAQLEALKAEIDQAKAWKSKLAQDPYSVMLEAGLTSDQVAAKMLQQPDPRDQQLLLLQQEIQALKNTQEQSSNKFTEIEKQQYENAKTQIRKDVTRLVTSDEAFETIKAMDAAEAVVELIEQSYLETGDLLDPMDAAREVEEYLMEEAFKIAKLKKIQSKLYPAQAVEDQQQQVVQQQQLIQQTQKPSMNTLSNRMAQTTTKPMTGKDRRERAIAAFLGKPL